MASEALFQLVFVLGLFVGLMFVMAVSWRSRGQKGESYVSERKHSVQSFFESAEGRVGEGELDEYMEDFESAKSPREVDRAEKALFREAVPKMQPNHAKKVYVFSMFSVSDRTREEVIGHVQDEVELLNGHFKFPVKVLDGNARHPKIKKTIEETLSSVVEKHGWRSYKLDLLDAYDALEGKFQDRKKKFNVIIVTGDSFEGKDLHYFPFEIKTGGRATGNIGPIVFLRLIGRYQVWHETGHLFGVPSPKKDYERYWNNCPNKSCLMNMNISGNWFCSECLKDIREAMA